MVVGRLLSYWEGNFSGAMLNFVRVFRSMVVEMVPLKGGIGGIVHPPIGRKNATYILPNLGGYMLPTTSYGNQKQPLIRCYVSLPKDRHVGLNIPEQ